MSASTEDSIEASPISKPALLDTDIKRTSSPKQDRHNHDERRKTKHPKHLRFLNINFNSARKKGKDLEAIIDCCDPDVIIGTETWLNQDIKTAEILPPALGFDCYRRDRKDSYGGILIAARQDLEISETESSDCVELLSATIKVREGKKMTDNRSVLSPS
ncbi:hypothetical protein ACOMHN_002642 [Nucella lapillus]